MKQNNFVSLEQALDRHPLMVAPETPLDEVITLMRKGWVNSCFLEENFAVSEQTPVDVSCVLAVANSQLIGIFTDGDLVKLIASRRNLSGLTLADVMNREVITLAATESEAVFAAINLFHKHQIRYLPIMDERAQLLGLVTPTILRRVLQSLDLLKFRIVKDVMSRAIHAIPAASVLEVAKLMSEYGVDCVAIAEPFPGSNSRVIRPLGIITDQDLVQFQSLELNLEQLQAQTVMSTPLFVVNEKDSLWTVHQLMEQHRVSRLVVVGEGGDLLGIISHSSLLRTISNIELQNSLKLLQDQFHSLESEKTKSLDQRNLDLERQLKQKTAELTERSQQEQLVAAIALRIRQSLNLESVLNATVEEVRELIQADRVLIYRFDSDGGGIVTTESVSNSKWSILNRVIRDACFEQAWIYGYEQGHIHAISDIYQSHLSPCYLEFLEQFQVKANIAIPILLTDSDSNCLWGLLIAHHCSSPRNWQQSELDLLQLLAIQVAIAIQQSELYEQTRRELNQRRQAELALQNSESRFHIMANTAPVMMWLAGTDKQFIFFNKHWLDFTGHSLEQELGDGWRQGVHPEDLAYCLDIYTSSFDARQEFSREYRLRCAAGNYRQILERSVPYFTDDGNFAGYIGYGIDISDRVSAKKLLQQQEELFRILVTSAPVGIFKTDQEGNCLYVNPRWQEIAGLSLEEALGTGWSNALHPDDREFVFSEWYNAARSGKEFTLEYRFRTPQGQITWVSCRAVPLYEPTEVIAGYLGTVTDINDRLATEAALQESETQLRTALEAADLGTWSWEMESNKVTLCNYAQSIFGFAPGEFPGTLEAALNCIHADDRDTINQKTRQLFEQGGLYDVEQRIVRPNGTIGWIAVRGHILRDANNQPIRMTGVIADITQKKQLEAQFLRNQRLESLGSLAGGIAHDLNNMLTPIMMSVQLLPLTLTNLDQRSQELLQMLDSNVKRGSALVKQILSFARGIDGDRGTLQIRHLIADIKQMIQETFPKSIEIKTDISRDLWTIYGDATQIHQILLNLMVNARDAMPNGGKLEISAENIVIDSESAPTHQDAKVGYYVAISITDTGIGIPSEIVEKIFEPFFTTKKSGQGTGLGLATVNNIVKKHDGFIEVISDLGQGTEFKVFLPATKEKTSEVQEYLTIAQGQGELILIVDDEATIREITKASLETHNYRAIAAKDGIEGIALYVRHQTEIAAVLMNMMMPSMSGTTAIRTLQKINPQVKIIAVSGQTFKEQDFREREITINAFLAKPYNTETLLTTIDEILQGDRFIEDSP